MSKKSTKKMAKKTAKTVKTVKTVEKAAPVATKTLTTAAFIKEKIAEGKMEDKEILAAARKRAPDQKIGDNYVSWYRWQLNSQKAA